MRRHRFLIAWLATFAVALQALWPLVAQAQPRERSVFAPLCAEGGSAHELEIKLGKSPLDERAAKHGEHCKLCVFGDGKAVVPAPHPEAVACAAKFASLPSAKAVFSSSSVFLSARPRAPPQAS
jgi:hypothetical protein